MNSWRFQFVFLTCLLNVFVQLDAQVLVAQNEIGSLEFAIQPFREGNILVSTREKLYEITIDGDKVQEFDFPTKMSDGDNVWFEYVHGEAITCDSSGVAWIMFQATRVEYEPERFVEWQHNCYGFATLDSRTGQFKLHYIPELPNSNNAGNTAIELLDEGDDLKKGIVLVHGKALLLDPDSKTVKKEIDLISCAAKSLNGGLAMGIDYHDLKNSSETRRSLRNRKHLVFPVDPKSFGRGNHIEIDTYPSAIAFDNDGRQYIGGADKLVVLSDGKKSTPINLKADFNIQSVTDLAFHPAGLMIVGSNKKELLITKPDPETGTLHLVREVDLDARGAHACVVGEQKHHD